MKQYIWNVEPRGAFKAGQFSQMVWRQSKELGVGLGRTKTGKVVVVASKYRRFTAMIQLNLFKKSFTSSLLPTRQYNRTVFAQCEEDKLKLEAEAAVKGKHQKVDFVSMSWQEKRMI